MKDNNEITSFGHRLPKEIYEDYHNIEKLKDQIEEAVKQSGLNDSTKHEIFKVLLNMHENFQALKKLKCHKPKQSF